MIRKIKPESVVPYLDAAGVQTVLMEEYVAEARVRTRDDLVNHVGSLHAAVVFAVAECASGALITTNFDIDVYTPLLKSTQVKYKSQVFREARAVARVDPSRLEDAKKALEDLGRADVPVEIEVYNEGDVLAAQVEILWALRKFSPTTTKP